MSFPLLSSPIRIAGLDIPNRTVMSPMSSGLGNPDGSVSPAQIAFYRERAEGGVGLIIVEFTCVDRRYGLAETNQLSLDNRANLPGHAALAAAIKEAGSRAALQLHLAGRYVDQRTVVGLPSGPNDEFSKRDATTQLARALTDAEIRRIIQSYGRSAELAMEAGYEAIEIHGAHGYLPMAFLSPLTNRRDDGWGGDFDRRLRFAEEVVRTIKSAIGPDRPLFYRLSSAEHLPGGLTIEDMEQVAPRLAAAGVDCLDVSSGSLAGSLDYTVDPMSMPEGWRFADSWRIRQAANVPVIGIGPVRWPETAESALLREDADLICLGRPLLADPRWPLKAFAGQAADIRACTNCNWCFDRVLQHQAIACAENPRTGNELEIPTPQTGAGRRAIVVGAGPGGMAAALELDKAGFQTHLFESRKRLGGGLIASAAPPLKDKLLWYLEHLEREIGSSSVKVHLAQEASAELLIAQCPAIAVIATGARPLPHAIAGIDDSMVISAYDLLMDDTDLEAPDGAAIAVYGGGETGCETAELLAAKGFAVLLITRSGRKDLARSAEAMYRKHLRRRLAANRRISIVDNTTILAVASSRIEARGPAGDTTLDVARLVMAQGRTPGSELAGDLQIANIPTFTIGDAHEVGRIGDAVHAAHAAVRAALLTK